MPCLEANRLRGGSVRAPAAGSRAARHKRIARDTCQRSFTSSYPLLRMHSMAYCCARVGSWVEIGKGAVCRAVAPDGVVMIVGAAGIGEASAMRDASSCAMRWHSARSRLDRFASAPGFCHVMLVQPASMAHSVKQAKLRFFMSREGG